MKSKNAFFSMSGLVALVAFSLFAGSGAANAAAPRQSQNPPNPNPERPRPVRFVGQVNQVSDRGVQLTARGGMTVTALVNPNTWILVEQNGTCAEGTVQDLQTGRPAAVAGMTTNQRGVVNARAIAQCRAGVTDVGNGKDLPANPAQGNGRERVKQELAKHAAAGTVKSVSGGTLTVTTLKGQDVTVNTNANTVVLNNGFVAVSSLKAGDKIELFGRPEKATGSTATRTITAWGIRVDNGTTKVMIGHVDSVSGNTLTLRTPKDRAGVQVTLGSKTGYKSVSVANQQVTIANASQADVKAGSNLIVEAVPSADGKSYTANAVILLPAGKVK